MEQLKNKIDREIDRKVVVLQVTESCNLNCTYCYQHSKQSKTADIENLKKIIRTEFEEENNFKEIEFDFIGGEPLLCISLIREICEWTWFQSWNKDYIFFATTNGVNIKEEDKKWFKEHKDMIWLGLSLDGTKAMHDTNRCNSYDKIDKDFFFGTWPEQYIKMTISPKTIDRFAEGVISLCNRNIKTAANLAYGIDWSSPKNEEALNKELHKLIDYYLENEDKDVIPLLNLPLFKLGENVKPERWCGAGIGMVAYDIEGHKYPCQMFYNTTGSMNCELSDTDITEFYKEYYNNCNCKPLFNICPICIGINYSENGGKYECNKDICNLMQVFFRANAFFQSQKIIKGLTKPFMDCDVKAVLNGIRIINNTLK